MKLILEIEGRIDNLQNHNSSKSKFKYNHLGDIVDHPQVVDSRMIHSAQRNRNGQKDNLD